jgi:peptidoglycan-associated lipoprotein
MDNILKFNNFVFIIRGYTMLQKRWNLLLALTLVFTLSLTSCGSKKKDGSSDDATASIVDDAASDGQTLELNGDSDSMRAGALSTIYFGYNSSSLNSSTKSTLDSNASYLKENTNVEIQIEGHADERGGIQYNLALGERRAKSVKDYLVALGVESSRVSTVSYGKERPLEFGHDEAAWSKNRRGNFVVTAK